MYREDIIGVQRIADVVDQWERPQHDWGDKTAWRLFNAATFALAGKVAERLRAVLSKLQLKHGAPGAGPLVTLSIGIATRVPDETVSADRLVMQADEALYAAKHTGRNRVVCADNILAALAQSVAERRRRPAAGNGDAMLIGG